MDIEKYLHLCTPEDLKEDRVAAVLGVMKDLQSPMEPGRTQKLRDTILSELRAGGWSSEVQLDYRSQITITAMNRDIGLCLQTGNMARCYADLLKFQLLYQRGRIQLAIYLLPTKRSAKIMGQNMAQFDRLVEELQIFAEVIAVPMIVIGFE